MQMTIEKIISSALDAVRKDPSCSVIDALQRASVDVDPLVRKQAADIVREASFHPELGMKENFQVVILERALRKALAVSKSSIGPSRPRDMAGRSSQQTPANAGTGRKNMSENNNEKAGSNPRSKKYNVGDTHSTVATLGLQPTDPSRKATCGFQFSRKTARAGVMDLPEGTDVLYIGARDVYEGVSSSKRMICRVTAGARVILDGQETTLADDIEIAFVVNHIDADDPYNIQARENETKRAEKARIKEAARAVSKTQAA